MSRYFTHSWTNDSRDYHYFDGRSGSLLLHTAGSEFRKRGVSDGDTVFVVSVVKGELHLIGQHGKQA